MYTIKVAQCLYVLMEGVNIEQNVAYVVYNITMVLDCWHDMIQLVARCSFIFWPRVFILGTIISNRSLINTKVSDYADDLRVKGQGQIF